MDTNSKTEFLNSRNPKEGTSFPYTVLKVIDDISEPRPAGFRIMHWHEDIQFILLSEGRIRIRTLDGYAELSEGEGCFINSNVMHMVERIGKCRYNSFIFPVRFTGFYAGSPAMHLAGRLFGNSDVPLIVFRDDADWQHECLMLLQTLSDLETHSDEFYQYEVLTRISQLSLTMLRNIKTGETKKASITNVRMQRMLDFISRNYQCRISLSDIAGSAFISRSECIRCFRRALNTTPYDYLIEFRLSKAADLLKTSDDSITDIALKTGFQQPSQFGQLFRKSRGCTPLQYRRSLHESG